MLSPLSRGYGTWSGNFDPYNEEGAESDSLPDIDTEPHRHGITVGFVAKTPPSTAVSNQYYSSLPGTPYHAREAIHSGRRLGSGRERSRAPSRENSDSQMNIPKTYLTRKGALMLFAAPEDEEEFLHTNVETRPRFMRVRKPTDLIDTSLKLGTLDKLAMSVLQFGDEDTDSIEGENKGTTEEKKKLYQKFVTKIDERDVDERSQPGGDVYYYLRDLKQKTSLQMGLTGDTALPRSREALELRAILRGLQNDSWPMTYRQDGPAFKKPSALAYQFSRPPSHLHQPPRNQYQRILSSAKLEESVQSLRSYLGRSLDDYDEYSQPLLTRRRAKFKDDVESARKSKYAQEGDDDIRKTLRAHVNTPTRPEGTCIVVDEHSDQEDESMVEDSQCMDAKSSARDDGYHSVSQGDNCSFILGPRNWTPVNSQAPKDEFLVPKTPKVDIKKMVDKGSKYVDGDSSSDEGLDGDGIVVGIGQGSDDSDVEIIYSNFDVPDNTFETFDDSQSNNTTFKVNSIVSDYAETLTNQDILMERENSIVINEGKCAIAENRLILDSTDNENRPEKQKELDYASSSVNSLHNLKTKTIENDIVGTSCDDDVFNDETELIASDGEEIEAPTKNENETNIVTNEKEAELEADSTDIVKSRTMSNSSIHKRSRTPSSMHSTAHDDDQSSVTILPHDQDLISVDVRSTKTPQSDTNQNSTQEFNEGSQATEMHAPMNDIVAQVKDEDVTGDDTTSVVMSMGEDSSTVVQTLEDLHDDDDESRDKLGEITDPRLPRNGRGRIDMIDNEDLNLHFTKTSTPFPPPTPTNESIPSPRYNILPAKDDSLDLKVLSRQNTPDSFLKSISHEIEKMDVDLNTRQKDETQVDIANDSSGRKSENNLTEEDKIEMDDLEELSRQTTPESISQVSLKSDSIEKRLNDSDIKTSFTLDSGHKGQSESKVMSPISIGIDSKLETEKKEAVSMKTSKPVTVSPKVSEHNSHVEKIHKIHSPVQRDESGSEKEEFNLNSAKLASRDSVLVRGDDSERTTPDCKLDIGAEIPQPMTGDATTDDKMSPGKSESSSKIDESTEEEATQATSITYQEGDSATKKKLEMPVIPDFLKPKPQPKAQKKDQKKRGQKGKKSTKSTSPTEITKAMDISSVQPDMTEDEITQIIKKKVTLPPEPEQAIIPDFVSEALKRSSERSRQKLEEEYREQQEMIRNEISDTLYEGNEGMTAEEFELAKKALREKEELTKDKLLKGKQQKKLEEKGKKSGGTNSIKSKKSKGAAVKDPLLAEKERIRALKEQEKQQRLEEIRALEEKIKASSNSISAEDQKFKDKLQEVQMELERIEREAEMAAQTEADVRQALKEDRMKRLEEKAKLKKEELNRKRLMMLEKKQEERKLKEEARQRELQKIMMLMDDEERKRRQEEEKKKQAEEEMEEEKRRKEEEEEMARLEREEEERRRQLEEEIEQEQLKRLQDEQDEIRKQQEQVAAQKQALLEEQRRKKELLALEEQRHMAELEMRQLEEARRLAEERARMEELQKLEEDVRETMRMDMEQRKENAIKRREYNLDAKSNLNRIRHSQGITRAWTWSYFVQWPMETYMRPVGEQEKLKKEAKLREKRKKAR